MWSWKFIIFGLAVFARAAIGEEYPCVKPNRGCRKMVECKDRRQCKTVYGDSPLDIALYGQYQPCQEYGEVRCLDLLLVEESSVEGIRPSSARPDETTEGQSMPDIQLMNTVIDVDEQQIQIQTSEATTLTDRPTTTSDAGKWSTISYQDSYLPQTTDLEKPTDSNKPDGNGSLHHTNPSQELEEQEPIILINLNDSQEDLSPSESVEKGEANIVNIGQGRPPTGAHLEIPTLAFVPVVVDGNEVWILASVVDNRPFNQPLPPTYGAIPHPHGPIAGYPHGPIAGYPHGPIAGYPHGPMAGYPNHPPLHHQISPTLDSPRLSPKGKIKALLKGKKNALRSLIRNKLRLITGRRVTKRSI